MRGGEENMAEIPGVDGQTHATGLRQADGLPVTVVPSVDVHQAPPGGISLLAESLSRRLGLGPRPNPLGPIHGEPQPNGNS